MRRARILFAVAALAAPAVGYAAAEVTVTQSGRAFSVRELRIARGTILRFVNVDEFIHHVYVNAPAFHFESEEQPPGQNLDVAFPVSGQFDVRCKIHPKMLLRVSVE